MIQTEVEACWKENVQKHLLCKSFHLIDARALLPCFTSSVEIHMASHINTQTHTWPVLGTQLSRAHQTAEVLLHCTAVLAVPLSARPGARLRLLSRAEMAGVERVPPEGILSLPNAAAPQLLATLLATLLNQRRRHKVKRKIGALGKNNSSRLDACERKKGRRGARE